MLTPTFQFLKFVFKKKKFFLENLAFSFESGNQSGGGYWIWGYCCVPFQLPDTTISCFPVWAFFWRWGSRGSGRWLQFCDWALEHRNLSVSQLLELDSNLSFFLWLKMEESVVWWTESRSGLTESGFQIWNLPGASVSQLLLCCVIRHKNETVWGEQS